MAEQFSAYLAEQLAARRMRQSQLAAYVGVAQSTVSAWLRGRSIPQPAQCAGIARVLHLPLEEVLAAAGHPVSSQGAAPPPLPQHVLPVLPLLEQLDEAEMAVVAETARALRELREARARYEAAGPAAPQQPPASEPAAPRPGRRPRRQ